ncbi:hypothetical protein TrCOL_g2728 [Triparma columacea]|uniref:Glycosyl transferase 64 domain-containing protein n=1 Tax=Triparma columacea TaxID=722753 RepID=A0A9W7GC48_9STRA|nr:hypothetical protein TrCOL_g2728 [Triparma columacea]
MEKYTIMINTKGTREIKGIIDNYKKCKNVHKIIVTFPQGTIPPNYIPQNSISIPSSSSSQSHISTSNIPPLVYHVPVSPSLNGRFQAYNTSQTSGIFTVDDDLFVPCKDVNLAYDVWVNGGYKDTGGMVGFYPRLIKKGKYHGWVGVWWTGEFQAVLTKASFVGRDRMREYWGEEYKDVRDVVERIGQCEDIAMGKLVAKGGGGVGYVGGGITDYGLLKGVSVGTKNHHKVRGGCVKEIDEIIGEGWGEGKWETVWWGWRRPGGWGEWISGDLGEFFKWRWMEGG